VTRLIVDGMAGLDDIQRVAAVLERPRTGYQRRLGQTPRAIALRSREAARQLGVFAERVEALSIDELRELYDETFQGVELGGVGALASVLVRQPTACGEARAALDTFAPILVRLAADRNPFAYAIRALCCVLLARAGEERLERSLP
jgi:nitrate reductase assembly molybdenum cofactor insertion protein NarJ